MKHEQECAELKNIQYKTMLLNGKTISSGDSANQNLINIESILDKEMDREQKEPWNRLDKTTKVQKLLIYIDVISEREKLGKTEKIALRNQIISYLDKKLLQRNKDVIYDKDTGVISDIPALEYITTSRKFTLKRASKPQPKTRKKPDKIDTDNKD